MLLWSLSIINLVRDRLPPLDMTAAIRPQSTGLTKLDEEDKETDELGEEGLEEHGLKGCGERSENTGAGSASCITGGCAPRHPLHPVSPALRLQARLCQNSQTWPGGCHKQDTVIKDEGRT